MAGYSKLPRSLHLSVSTRVSTFRHGTVCLSTVSAVY